MYYFIISIYVTIETRITLLDNSRHFPCKNIYVDNLHNVHSVFSRSNDNLPKRVYMKKAPIILCASKKTIANGVMLKRDLLNEILHFSANSDNTFF